MALALPNVTTNDLHRPGFHLHRHTQRQEYVIKLSAASATDRGRKVQVSGNLLDVKPVARYAGLLYEDGSSFFSASASGAALYDIGRGYKFDEMRCSESLQVARKPIEQSWELQSKTTPVRPQ